MMLYALAHLLVSLLAKPLFRLRVEGLHHIPDQGPLIIAANHMSHLDIPLLGCSLRRRANFVGKSELFQIPLLGRLLRLLGGIPIRRDGMDRGAMEEIRHRLHQGRILVICVEGKRSLDGRLQRAKAGVGMIVAMTGVQVIPALIEGTHRALPKGAKWIRLAPVSITFGPPVDLPAWKGKSGGKSAYQGIADRIMEGIASLARTSEQASLGEREGVPSKRGRQPEW
jgi:1-acyl-sn-glycerol-3-phosphate acyltransferase